MNKKIAVRSGLITGMLIAAYILIITSAKINANSPLIFIQYGILLIGLISSCALLYKYYADIKFLDAFIHCVRTGINALIIIILANTLLYFLLNTAAERSMKSFQWLLMKTIFSFSITGLVTAFFTSAIFNTFTKNKK